MDIVIANDFDQGTAFVVNLKPMRSFEKYSPQSLGPESKASGSIQQQQAAKQTQPPALLTESVTIFQRQLVKKLRVGYIGARQQPITKS